MNTYTLVYFFFHWSFYLIYIRIQSGFSTFIITIPNSLHLKLLKIKPYRLNYIFKYINFDLIG